MLSSASVENDLRMRNQHDLRLVARRDFPQQYVNLFLTKNLEMRIRFVDKQYASRMRVEIREDQKHLLEAASGKGQVEGFFRIGLSIMQIDASPRILGRISKFDGKRPVHQLLYPFPVIGRLPEHEEAQVAKHLGRLTLPQERVDAAGLKNGFVRFKAGHRV